MNVQTAFRIAKLFTRHGWAVERQLEDILENEPDDTDDLIAMSDRGDLNRNAVAIIVDELDAVSVLVGDPHDANHDEFLSTQAAALRDMLRDFLNGEHDSDFPTED